MVKATMIGGSDAEFEVMGYVYGHSSVVGLMAVLRDDEGDLQDVPISRIRIVVEPKATSPRGYAEAFYAIGQVLGFGASPRTPMDVFHQSMLPRLHELVANEKSAEKERLRFEGDLDRWMRTIGGPVTGFQPEAYAIMDAACHELVRLRVENAKLRRCLFPVVMGMAQAEACNEPVADSDVVMSFMGSGGSDQVTAGELRAALGSQFEECDHQWVDARNGDVESGEMCPKCGAIRAAENKDAPR